MRRNHIKVVHAASRPRDALYGVILAKITGARSIIHLHVMVSDWFSPIMRWSLRQCDAVLSISEFVRRSVVAAGYSPDRTFVVLNSLDINDWDPTLDSTSLRIELGISSQAPVLAIISRLFYWKGHTQLLTALTLVRQHVPGVKLLIVGEDDPGAHPGGGSYRAELESLVHELGLADNVIFTGFRSDVPRVLAACDIFTMPSFEEPLGVAFLEAMAMEKPVIALRSGGVAEVVEHGKDGLLSDPHDIEGLASNIVRLLSDPVLRGAMGKHGRAHVKEKHCPRHIASEVESVYRKVTHENHARVSTAFPV